MQSKFAVTDRTRVRRIVDRADYDQATIYTALDEAFFASIAFSDGTNVHAIPTAIWRENQHLYIHGSNGSRLIKCLQQGIQVCISVTTIQGLVLARSAFHHSMNYTSVCIYGSFATVDPAEKNLHMRNFMEHWMPGRWEHVRQPDKNELAATTVMRIPIVEAVLKSRKGDPKDDASDMDQVVWAGIMPLQSQWQKPQQVKEQDNPDLPGQALRALKKIVTTRPLRG